MEFEKEKKQKGAIKVINEVQYTNSTGTFLHNVTDISMINDASKLDNYEKFLNKTFSESQSEEETKKNQKISGNYITVIFKNII